MTRDDILAIQRRLSELGIYGGAIDGIAGPKTLAAIRGFQRINGLKPDGIAGPKTKEELFPGPVAGRDDDDDAPAPGARPAPVKATQWPRQADVRTFYGEPGGPDCTAGTVVLPAPMVIAWNKTQRISHFKCHAKVAEPMTRIHQETFTHYGEKEWRRLRLDLFGGCYALRKMRGGSNFSMHAYGIAEDTDPERNQLRWGRDRATLDNAEYEAFWNIVESEGAVSLGRLKNFDWMHFQFARL